MRWVDYRRLGQHEDSQGHNLISILRKRKYQVPVADKRHLCELQIRSLLKLCRWGWPCQGPDPRGPRWYSKRSRGRLLGHEYARAWSCPAIQVLNLVPISQHGSLLDFGKSNPAQKARRHLDSFEHAAVWPSHRKVVQLVANFHSWCWINWSNGWDVTAELLIRRT